jgi:1,4-dihydroxy-2-naphthoate octaprenyltransferase
MPRHRVELQAASAIKESPVLNPVVFGVTRPTFLVLSPICVSLGVAAAARGSTALDWIAVAIALIGAVAAHISVNALNEYEDFESGLDFHTHRTPFSGGSGTLVAHPDLAMQARNIGRAGLLLTALCGAILVWRAGAGLLPIGALGLAVIYTYTSHINRSRFLCLIAPGLGFGPLMVIGAAYAATGHWSLDALLASLIPFFLVSNLLLLNQFPDVQADRVVGRNTLPVAIGAAASLRVYGLFCTLAYLSIGVGALSGSLPLASLVGLATAPAALSVVIGVRRFLEQTARVDAWITPILACNVLVSLLTPALVTGGLLLS